MLIGLAMRPALIPFVIESTMMKTSSSWPAASWSLVVTKKLRKEKLVMVEDDRRRHLNGGARSPHPRSHCTPVRTAPGEDPPSTIAARPVSRS
jgi:hypothetical protein